MNLLGMLQFLVLVTVHHFILIIARIIFQCWVKEQLMSYGRAGAAEKKFSINFSKAKTKNGLSLHPNYDNSYLFVNGAEIYNPIQEEQPPPPPPLPAFPLLLRQT